MDIEGIEIRSLYKIFGERPEDFVEKVAKGMGKGDLMAHGHVLGLRDISLRMPGGRIQVIMGLSGSGKSTLIRHINRLIEPTAGEILVDGINVVKLDARGLRDFRRRYTAMVFQKFALLPHWTVLDNAMFGLKIKGVPRAQAEETARRWLDRVGLAGFAGKYPSQLSGGMQQRVGLARALANDAPILLMDEAFSALDPLIRVDMQSVLLDLQKEIRKTIVFITHDLDEALRLGDNIAILRDGEIVQNGSPSEIVMSPADAYVASFVREVNRGRVIRVGSIMRGLMGGGPPLGLTRLDETLTLEEAARCLSQARATLGVVVDGNDRPLGTTDLADIVAAMVRAEDAAPSGPAATELALPVRSDRETQRRSAET